MLRSALIVTLALGPAAPMAMAQEIKKHELDQERTVVVPLEQQRLSSHLPQTLVIREDSRDAKKVEVAHVKDRLAPGQTAQNMTFEKMALNSEVRGIAYESGDELDKTSSTNSWGFGLALGLGALGLGIASNSAWANRANGYDYYPSAAYRPNYYGNSVYSYPRAYGYNYASNYRPYYSYAGYRYAYSPYYRYASGPYTYTYCNWPSSYYQ